MIDVFGTINAPDTFGYPNASFSVTPIDSVNGAAPRYFNQTGYITPIVEPTVATTHMEFFKSGTLGPGNHTMVLSAEGLQGDATFYFDFLRVSVPDNGTYDSMIVDDSETNWIYSSNWLKGNHAGEYLDTWHSSPLEGGTSQLAFYGSKIAVYGALGGTYDPDQVLAEITIDNEPAHIITVQNVTHQVQNDDLTLRNQLIFSTSGMRDLGATRRTMSISVPFITNPPSPRPIISAPSWFADYAIYGPYTATTGGSSSPTPVPSSSSTASTDVAPPTGQLNGGAIAGVVIGVVIGISALIGLLFFWLKKRQNQNKTKRETMVQQVYPTTLNQHPHHSPVLDISPFSSNFPRDTVDQPHTAVPWSADIKGSRVGGTQSHSGSSQVRSPTVVSSSHSPVDSGSGPRSAVQEVDGGVRLATSTTYGSEILPPRYAPYDQDN